MLCIQVRGLLPIFRFLSRAPEHLTIPYEGEDIKMKYRQGYMELRFVV